MMRYSVLSFFLYWRAQRNGRFILSLKCAEMVCAIQLVFVYSQKKSRTATRCIRCLLVRQLFFTLLLHFSSFFF